ncbi:MAG: FAD binding domain-containing protein [Polyangiaceae bacterium]|nr:FAD binding domain-containing protein [Polyangiaceae bacterium]
MLRLPQLQVARPRTVEEALALLGGEGALPFAGGTDLLPNLKHRLLAPQTLVSLAGVEGLSGVSVDPGGALVIGATTRLHEVAEHPEVRARAPALAMAAGLVASPQIRRMGTLGGNVLLDTRCRYVNQSAFWRKSLGHCLKKDGAVCHVVPGGQKCVAAASNDTAPALLTLGASLTVATAAGTREVPLESLWKPDGVYNRRLAPNELVTAIRVPAQAAGHRGAYLKLRPRESFDFPLLGVAVRVDAAGGVVQSADVVVVALQAVPRRVTGASDELAGKALGTQELEAAIVAVGARAHQQCRPLPNVPGDPDYRREMVPVFVRRALRAAAG